MKPSAQERMIAALEIDQTAIDRLRIYEKLLRKWSAVKNLVAPSTLNDIWARHFLDSAQVQRACPNASVWVDLGSGGGFPGLVTAILLADRPGAIVHLIESDHRKCAFLRDVSRETGLSTKVYHARIEDIIDDFARIDAVSARALADMATLVQWSSPLLEKGALGVFQKGKGVAAELTELTRDSRFEIEIRPSISQSDGALVLIRNRDQSNGAAREHS